MNDRFYPVGWVQDGQRWDGSSWHALDAAAPVRDPAGQPVAHAAVPSYAPPAASTPAPVAPHELPPPAVQPLPAAPAGIDRWGAPTTSAAGPAWMSTAAPVSAGGGFGVPGAAAPLPRLVPSAPSSAAAAAPYFILGVLVAFGVTAAGLWVMSSGGGGLIWYGGYFVAFALWRRAWAAYSEARVLGGAGISGTTTAVAVVLVLASIGACGALALARINYGKAPDVPLSAQTVGSCFAVDADDNVLPADCSDPSANYEAVAERADRALCPRQTIGTITNDYGLELCLVPHTS